MTGILEEQELMTESDLRRDLRIEGLLREWNLEFTFEPEFPLAKIDADYEDSQVRKRDHRAPRENVEEYALQMRNGALFPPLVITHNRRLVDGNTRIGGCKQNAIETFPVYTVKLPSAAYGPMLGAALNQMGGKRLTADESFKAAELMINAGQSDEAIARTLGRSRQSVQNYRREQRYKNAAERTGVVAAAVTRTAQRHLADIGHDEPFKAAVQLVSTAKPAQKDVQELVDRVNNARSEHEELQVVDEYRNKWRPAGPPPQKKMPTRAATAAGRKVDALLQSVTVPPSELAPAVLRAELEPKWARLLDLASRVLEAFAEAPVEQPLPETTASS